MAYHNGKEANNGDSQAETWKTDQHNGTGSPETYNFLTSIGYSTSDLSSDGQATSNANHEQYENSRDALWVRDIQASCGSSGWTAHSFIAVNDTSITSTGPNSQNAGAWWQNGFYGSWSASYTTPMYEMRIQGEVPSGGTVLNESSHWSGNSAGVGYILKDNLDYFTHSSGLDLIDSCDNLASLIQSHGAQPGA